MQWRNRLLDPDIASLNPDIVFLAKSLAQICDNIPGGIVQNIAGHTFKIMREYMRNAGVFRNNEEREENHESENQMPNQEDVEEEAEAPIDSKLQNWMGCQSSG